MSKEDQIIVLRDNAKSDLIQIKSIEDGLGHLSKVRSIETWVKAEKMDAELQNLVAEQKIRTQRILGELIREGQGKGEIASQYSNRRIDIVRNDDYIKIPKTTADLGITRNQSSTFQHIASIPEDDFESFIAEKKANVNKAVSELTTSAAVKLAKKYRTREEHVVEINKLRDLNNQKERYDEIDNLIKMINGNYNIVERRIIASKIKT